jgi:hypothetical protein
MSVPVGLALRRCCAEDIDAVTAALVAEEVAVTGTPTWDADDTAEHLTWEKEVA